jgi:hypothetical protein
MQCFHHRILILSQRPPRLLSIAPERSAPREPPQQGRSQVTDWLPSAHAGACFVPRSLARVSFHSRVFARLARLRPSVFRSGAPDIWSPISNRDDSDNRTVGSDNRRCHVPSLRRFEVPSRAGSAIARGNSQFTRAMRSWLRPCVCAAASRNRPPLVDASSAQSTEEEL